MSAIEKLLIALLMLILVSSCTTNTNTATQKQQSQKTTEVSSSEKVATVKIDGSSTIYPITQASAKERSQQF
ncbi:MAG: hypothetical protein HXY43_09850 [Fischerella sp.]|jgi:phosphate transport system substrate-binding protein|uniref:hypothetical protein n=1 Tax=Fischerella sp. TaxID=1191 RepID=UPI0017FB7D3E|nr:hypothetical protein [Fischerella sp.]NWF59579.1 hypothetical protein [Fischerella sp.]